MAIVDGKIRCSGCKVFKELGNFQPSIVSRGSGVCKICKYEAKKVYYKNNKEKYAASRRRRIQSRIEEHRNVVNLWNRNNPERIKSYNLRKYGLSLQQYREMLSSQGSNCACCGLVSSSQAVLFVDHCHSTGKIRGLICKKCNSGIAALGDDVNGILKALNYLQAKG